MERKTGVLHPLDFAVPLKTEGLGLPTDENKPQIPRFRVGFRSKNGKAKNLSSWLLIWVFSSGRFPFHFYVYLATTPNTKDLTDDVGNFQEYGSLVWLLGKLGGMDGA